MGGENGYARGGGEGPTRVGHGRDKRRGDADQSMPSLGNPTARKDPSMPGSYPSRSVFTARRQRVLLECHWKAPKGYAY